MKEKAKQGRVLTIKRTIKLIQSDTDDAFSEILETAKAQFEAKKWDCDAYCIRALGKVGRRKERLDAAREALVAGLPVAIERDNAPGLAAGGVALGLLGDERAGEMLMTAWADALKAGNHELDVASGFLAVAAAVLGCRSASFIASLREHDVDMQDYWGQYQYAIWLMEADSGAALAQSLTGKRERGRIFSIAALSDMPAPAETISQLANALRTFGSLWARRLASVAVARAGKAVQPHERLVWHLGITHPLELQHGADETELLDEEEALLPEFVCNETVDSVAAADNPTAGEQAIIAKHVFNMVSGLGLDELKRLPWQRFVFAMRNASGHTPLQAAIMHHCGDHETRARDIALFLAQKAHDVNEAGPNGDTALHLVARKTVRGNIDIVKVLLGRGADPSIKNTSGRTALELAKDPLVLELLRVASGQGV